MRIRILDCWEALHGRAVRWRWWARLALAAAVLLWFWRQALPRVTARPADPNLQSTMWTVVPQPDPAAGLLAAIGKIPPQPPLPLPPKLPAGKHWEPTALARDINTPPASIDLEEALHGPWTPDARYRLRAVISLPRDPVCAGGAG